MKPIEEVFRLWKDFESRASAKRSTQISRIKEDRTFLSGTQWDNSDTGLVANDRPKRVINVLANSINSTTNGYANYPYKWYSDDAEIDDAANAFLKYGSNARAAYDVLYSDVAFGLGYFAIGSDTVYDANGEPTEVPALYSVDRVENVYFDPDSIEIDGRDAVEAAIVELRSKNYIQAKYGDEWVTARGVRAPINVTDNHNAECMAIVTYFRVEDGKCSVYRLLKDKFLEEPTQIDLERVPVFPVYGERTWNGDDVLWQGLVRKGAAIQKIINYAFTTLGERLAKAPKQIWRTRPETVDGYEDGYKAFDANLNPLLLYNPTSDDGKIAYDPPERLDNKVDFADITGIIGANLELMSTITGVDAKGIMSDAPQVTATEVIYNERQTQCTIRHFYANLRDTFKAVGEAILRLMGYGIVTLDVIQGPAEYMEKQVARQELIQLAGIVPETEKMKLVDGILLSHNDNAILRNVFGAIHAVQQPSAMEEEAMQTVEIMKNTILEKDQQIQDLQEQLKQWKAYDDNNERQLQADFAKSAMDHKFKQEDMILQAQLDQGLDVNKAAYENEKQQMELAKQAVQLDAAKAKAQADIAKNLMGGF